ncbi:MAG: hypothetical protein RLZZ241_1038 [Bacteroidota bacterium]|jgi:hypothetical protein
MEQQYRRTLTLIAAENRWNFVTLNKMYPYEQGALARDFKGDASCN